MLPFDRKPWAKPVAALMIAITLISASVVAIYLHQTRGLDTGAITAILLVLLAVVPPNIVILRQKRIEDRRQTATMVPFRTPGR